MAIAIGLLIGLILGLTGAGGSVLAVPLLMAGLHQSLAQSTGLSLGAVAAAAAIGVLIRLGRGQIAWAPAGFVAVGGVIFTPFGRALAAVLPQMVVLVLFTVLVCAIAVRMWLQAQRHPQETLELRAAVATDGARPELVCRYSASGQFELRLPCILRLVLVGVLTGLLSGLFGVGGGFVIVPALVLLTGMSMRFAVATSLMVIALVSSVGFAVFLRTSPVPLPLLLHVAFGGLFGMLAGTVLSPRLAGPALQKLFVVLMVVLAFYTLLQAWL